MPAIRTTTSTSTPSACGQGPRVSACSDTQKHKNMKGRTAEATTPAVHSGCPTQQHAAQRHDQPPLRGQARKTVYECAHSACATAGRRSALCSEQRTRDASCKNTARTACGRAEHVCLGAERRKGVPERAAHCFQERLGAARQLAQQRAPQVLQVLLPAAAAAVGAAAGH